MGGGLDKKILKSPNLVVEAVCRYRISEMFASAVLEEEEVREERVEERVGEADKQEVEEKEEVENAFDKLFSS